MRTAIAVALLAGLAGSVSAAGVSDVGVGVVLGEPIGATAKVWFDDTLAADVGAGFSDGNGGFWADALWHDWTLLPQPSNGRLGAYLGAGPQIRAGDDVRFGIRTIVGASYRPTRHPLEVFAEIGPLFRFTQGGHVDPVGGVGIRLMLGSAKKN